MPGLAADDGVTEDAATPDSLSSWQTSCATCSAGDPAGACDESPGFPSIRNLGGFLAASFCLRDCRPLHAADRAFFYLSAQGVAEVSELG
jgi:hypothetical protein